MRAQRERDMLLPPMIAAYVIASAGCCLLVRRLTGSTLAGAFGGLVYGFSGVMLAHISHFNQIHAAAWLPLVAYGLYLIRLDRHRAGAVIVAVAYSLMWLAGHPQVTVYTFYLSAALVCGWLLIDRPERALVMTRGIWSGAGLAAGVGLAAVAILPMLELGALSRRSSVRWDLYIEDALPLRQLLGLVFPLGFGGFFTPSDIRVAYIGESSPLQTTSYMGLLPLGLAAVAAFATPAARREARLWAGLAGIGLLLCLGPATPVGWLFFYVPGYAGFQLPARHLFLVTFCLAVASGIGLAHVAQVPRARRRTAAAIAGVMAVALACGAWVGWRAPDVRGLIAGSETYVTWALVWPLTVAAALACVALIGSAMGESAKRAGILFGIVLAAIHVVDLAVVHYMLPGYQFRYADVRPADLVPRPSVAALGAELRASGQRVLAVDGSRNPFLLPNFPRAWEIPSTSGTGSLGIERYVDMLRMGGSGDVDPDTFAPEHQALDLLGVRYALVPQQSPIAANLLAHPDRWGAVSNLKYEEGDPDSWYTLFSNARARPRAWCASGVVSASAPEVLSTLRSGRLPDGQPFDVARTALVERVPTAGWSEGPAGDASHEIETTAAGPGERTYLVTSSSPCMLVLSEVYYPWWRASVDQSPEDVLRVNHALIAVPLAQGSHIVRLWLRPVSLWVGGVISVFTGLALAALYFSRQ